MIRILLVYVYCLIGVHLFGHGELDQKIKAVSIQILQAPDSTELFLNRGELYYQHEEYQNSIDDFKVCLERGDTENRLYLNFAKSFLELNNADSAFYFVDKILEQTPLHILALKVQGRTFIKTGQYREAAAVYELVINHVDKAHVDNYFDAVNALQLCESEIYLERAIRILEDGVTDLGPLLIFHKRKAEIHLLLGEIPEALAQHDIIISNSNRKERPLFEKALLLKENNQIEESIRILHESLTALEDLPNRIKSNKASLHLKTEIIEEINKTKN